MGGCFTAHFFFGIFFIQSSKHHTAQNVRKGGQAPGDGVGQQAQRHEEHGDTQHEQGGGVIALDEPRKQGAEQAEPAQASRIAPDIPVASLTTAARTMQVMAKGSTTIRSRKRMVKSF